MQISTRPDLVQSWLSDKRLTGLEKKIIEAHLLVRNNKNQEAILLLEGTRTTTVPFIGAHRDLLLGIAHNHSENYKHSIRHLTDAERAFGELNLSYYQFTCLYNLFFAYGNLFELTRTKHVLEKMRKIPTETELMKQRLLRCEFIYASDSGDFKTAAFYLDKIQAILGTWSESDFTSHLVSEFMFYVQYGKFKKAEETLEKFKSAKKFILKDSFKYMKKLLDHYLYDSPIYTLQGQFEEIPVQHLEIQVLQSFEGMDLDKARTLWRELQALIPSKYLDDFKFNSPQTLFSACLDKHLAKKQVTQEVVIEVSADKRVGKLIQVLGQLNAPIKKDHLYELVYGEHPTTKDDINRLSRMLSKIRHKLPFEIKTSKGTYIVEKKRKAS